MYIHSGRFPLTQQIGYKTRGPNKTRKITDLVWKVYDSLSDLRGHGADPTNDNRTRTDRQGQDDHNVERSSTLKLQSVLSALFEKPLLVVISLR